MSWPNPVSGLKRVYRRTRRWPVRSRIALVSAALTAVILIAFALVVGRLVSNRLHADFENDLQANAPRRSRTAGSSCRSSTVSLRINPPIADIGVPNDVEVRVVSADGSSPPPAGSGFLGVPNPTSVIPVGSLQVASAPILHERPRPPPALPPVRAPRILGRRDDRAALAVPRPWGWRSARSSPGSPAWLSPTGRCGRSRR